MKKTLLTGSLATLLLLAACGTTEEDTTEEVNEESTTESSDLATENEELKEQNQQLQEQIVALEEQIAEVQESNTEVETNEIEEEVSEDVATEEGPDTIASIEPKETLELDTVNLTINEVVIANLQPNEMTAAAIMHRDVEPGDTLDVIGIGYTLENTSEDPRNFFIDQAEIVTSTGEQLQPELMLSDGIQSQMAGAVSSTGIVFYILEDGTGEDLEWIDIVIPMVSDDEFNMYTEEQNHRIEF